MAESMVMFKRLSIDTDGGTFSITQSAKSLSKALEQELTYYNDRGKVPAQINISEVE